MLAGYVLVLSFLLLCNCISSLLVNVSNTVVRHDINNIPMDTHDGNIVQWSQGGLYYFYSMGYQNCTLEHGIIPPQECPGIYKSYGSCGFRTDHALRVYSSPDVIHWTSVSEEALPVRPYGIYFRPKVIYNKRSDMYLLWINHLANASRPLVAYPDARYIVAASSSPEGPFVVVNEDVHLPYTGAGDFSIMVDSSNPDLAYLAYDSWETDHSMSVEQLNENFTDTLGLTASSGLLPPTSVEAPALFQHESFYYLMFGHTCCFCRQGGGAEMWVATHPLGPWTSMNTELNPKKHLSLTHIIPAQNSFVFSVTLSDSSSVLIYAGDLWSSSQDNLKSHDLQYWQPLVFETDESTPSAPPTIATFVWQDWFVLDLM